MSNPILFTAMIGWLDEREKEGRYGERTRQTYVSLFRRIAEVLGAVPVRELSHKDINAAIGVWQKQFAPKTVRGMYDLLNKIMGDLVLDGKLDANPCARVKPPAVPRSLKRKNLLTPEMQRVLAHAQADPNVGRAVRLCLATGIRRTEACWIRWSDFDWVRGTVAIRKSKTAAGIRVVHVPDNVLNEFKSLAPNAPSEWVFTNSSGGQKSPDVLGDQIKRALRDAGVPTATMHTLRHTHASLLLKKKLPIPAVSKRLGHASPAVTLNVYAHTMDEDDEEAAKAIGGLF